MRRKDRIINTDRAIEIMKEASYCVISSSPLGTNYEDSTNILDMNKSNNFAEYPNGFKNLNNIYSHLQKNSNALDSQGNITPHYQIFSIPISFVYNNKKLFIHTAKAGRKISFFKDGSLLCAVFIGRVQVPDLYSNEQLEQIVLKEPKKLGSEVFTTEYESVIAYGKIYAIHDIGEQNIAMRLLCEKYMPDKMAFVQTSVNVERKHMNIYEIRLQDISAKAKKL